MTAPRIRIHSAETRTEALAMYRNGLTPRQIAARLCVPYEAVRYWCDYTDGKIVTKAKPAKRKGS